MRRRWDIDDRGRGVASAAAEVPALDRLRGAMLEPDWWPSNPSSILLPHIHRACAEHGWSVVRADVVDAVLDGDSYFAPHGHVVRLRVTTESSDRA